MAEQQQDVETLKRRSRRRLVGAVALVVFAVIVLPMVFDPEPKPSAPAVSTRIPGEDEAPFKPKAKAPEKKEEKKAAAPAPAPVAKKEEPKKEPARPDAKEKARAEAALAGAEFVVPVGAFANPDGVIAKLAAAKIPYYTEKIPGNLTRVRAGPFPSKDAADNAQSTLRGMGLQPGGVTAKSG
jgi:DedD protein